MTQPNRATSFAVLVVDDDELVRESFCEVLELHGYDVYSAENGRVALEVVERLPRPAVILLDYMMPVMNGAQFLAELRRGHHADLPVVFVSAFADRASDLPAEAILEKPVRPTLLMQTLDRVARKEVA